MLSRLYSLLLVLALLLVWQCEAFNQVNAQTAGDKQLSKNETKLATELEQDKSILEMKCKADRRGLWDCREVNQLKLSLYNAARSGTGILKAKVYGNTKEGDRIIHYLIVEQGAVRLIRDYSRDETSLPHVITIICSNLELAHIEDYKLKPIIDKDIEVAKNKKLIALVCLEENQNQLENGYRF